MTRDGIRGPGHIRDALQAVSAELPEVRRPVGRPGLLSRHARRIITRRHHCRLTISISLVPCVDISCSCDDKRCLILTRCRWLRSRGHHSDETHRSLLGQIEGQGRICKTDVAGGVLSLFHRLKYMQWLARCRRERSSLGLGVKPQRDDVLRGARTTCPSCRYSQL